MEQIDNDNEQMQVIVDVIKGRERKWKRFLKKIAKRKKEKYER